MPVASWFLLMFLLHRPIPDQQAIDSWVTAFPVSYADQASCQMDAQSASTARRIYNSTGVRTNYLAQKIGIQIVTMCVQGFAFGDGQ